MGHKVNPIGFRLQLNKNWQSKWFAPRSFAKNLAEDIEIRTLLGKRFGKNAGVAKIELSRDQDAIKVAIYSSKPGILIGRSGQGINEIKTYLLKNCLQIRNNKTGLANKKIEIEIMEIKNGELSAEIVAQQIVHQIERRIAYKRAIKQTIAKVMEKRALGVKVVIAGRLGGAEIARREHYGNGSIPLGRLRADIDYAQVDALTTYGIIGVKVWIYKGDIIESL
ncbi:MAG: 30S ribosomal protein S3 [Berkelbacteria bacterium GW2011_GWB1_38_5]|uniref:Small ribosomal subunit protein uS3 n=3 Tax=root TaxID=1 RepID=A0A0G0PNS1_9BACT|nr:30S ribosomal protein S3 [uncultured organism]KKQ74610.1 MAG: 30S ribosomal protein S3 [Berkelbacteria bacterium GW2011_GWB1_38_5]KKQ90971.1 MAG: 30S ribosomal protein S3 [Berkelbacteria bacterium GW2011_GWA1_39_10]